MFVVQTWMCGALVDRTCKETVGTVLDDMEIASEAIVQLIEARLFCGASGCSFFLAA